ncbi:hypothetical protein D1Z90_02950 [Motilimonas pumila]|uniref:Uncharacterized protein n=2 Tax=Motilimonas pumila TaxID=2303987 RepID=A0A418YII4_9GAMM|nr:hypothetical protein D1Z90_02950 [Motilimonas pumila]
MIHAPKSYLAVNFILLFISVLSVFVVIFEPTVLIDTQAALSHTPVSLDSHYQADASGSLLLLTCIILVIHRQKLNMTNFF